MAVSIIIKSVFIFYLHFYKVQPNATSNIFHIFIRGCVIDGKFVNKLMFLCGSEFKPLAI